MIIAIFSGTREATEKLHKELVREQLLILKPSAVIVGGARGIDTVVEKLCKELHIPVLVVTANWAVQGKAAGGKRNGRMLSLAQTLFYKCEVHGVCFPASNVPSHGTQDMISKLKTAEIPVKEIPIEVEQEVWEWKTMTTES